MKFKRDQRIQSVTTLLEICLKFRENTDYECCLMRAKLHRAVHNRLVL